MTALLLIVLIGACAVSVAAEATVIDATTFGVKPNTGTDSTEAIQKAIAATAKVNGPVVLKFQPGRYDLFRETSTKAKYWISNTVSEGEIPDATKSIGVYLKDMKHLTIDGGGALFMYHGKMMLFGLDRCEDVLIRNLHLDFARPTMSELTVEAVTNTTLDARIHPDSTYKIENGKLTWVGEGWVSTGHLSQPFEPVRGNTWRGWNPVRTATKAEELKPFFVRFTYPNRPDAHTGMIFQMRETTRDHVGVLMLHCKDITWEDVGLHYMHGLGLVGQFSENLTFRRIVCEPRPESGRTCAGFADFMQISGCRGTVRVLDSRFNGSHDDPINVHGTHLRIVERPAPERIKVRFIHAETWGFEAFYAGDEIEFVHAKSLLSYGAGVVKTAERINPKEMMLTLEKPMPEGFVDGDCIENVTWTPELEVRGCRFSATPVRGILVTTRRKVVIADNVFVRTPMSTILIADDARNWFESGPVRDVTISGNQFIECGEPVISISPENTEHMPGRCVHSNVRIVDNIFRRAGGGMPVVASSTADVVCTGNIICQPGGGSADNMIRLEHDSTGTVKDNRNEVKRTAAAFPLDGTRDLDLTVGHTSLCVSGKQMARDGEGVAGGPLRIGDQIFGRGIGTHAPSEIAFPLEGKYRWFTTHVGVNVVHGAKGTVTVQVWLDEKKIHETPLMRGGEKAPYICLPVTGGRELRLVVTDGGDGNANDHAAICLPRVTIGAAEPAPNTP